MSYKEYEKRYDHCQRLARATYRVHIFDIVSSKKHHPYPMGQIRQAMQEACECIQHEYGSAIACPSQDDIWASSVYIGDENTKFFQMGDLFGVCTPTDTITDEEIELAFVKTKRMHDIGYMFHAGHAFFDTFNYGEGDNRLYFGYAFMILEDRCKSDQNNVL